MSITINMTKAKVIAHDACRVSRNADALKALMPTRDLLE